jgi:hypothetical protein
MVMHTSQREAGFDLPESIAAIPVCQLSPPLSKVTITCRGGVFFPAFTDGNSILC